MADANYTVYVHTTPNGKRYVGITHIKPTKRWSNGNGYRCNSYFTNAIKKYGWNHIQHIIVAKNLSREDACQYEQELIAKYKTDDRRYGYNLTSGGEKGARFSEESRRKLSESHKGLRYNIGVPFTEERKEKLRGPRPSVAGKNNPSYGRKWTPEEIAIRQSHRKYASGGEHPGARPILQKDMDGNIVKRWGSISEASHFYCRNSIKECLRGNYKQHRGFIWEYEAGGKQDANQTRERV